MERDEIVQIVVNNLEHLMEVRGMNAASLAKAAHLNYTGVYDILKGKVRDPRIGTLNRIAAALNVPISSLLEARQSKDLRQEYLEVFAMLPPEERTRLLQAARAWLTPETSAQTR